MRPKNYGYEYVEKDGMRKSTCKVKGLTLDYNTRNSYIFIACWNGHNLTAETFKKLFPIIESENTKTEE